jgi:putative CocE/NonD family hydrolase
VTRWYLRPGRGLAPDPPVDSEPDRYIYDPAHPTPSVGGAVLGRHAGPRDNRALEARSDVLTYTSLPLEGELEPLGPVSVELYLESSLAHTDLFARLCVVQPDGRSVNVSDGIVRIGQERATTLPTDRIRRVALDLWPTALRYQRGQRIRLQVSSGAHPRFSRNTGTGEPLATAATLRPAHLAVYHDPAHPSALRLPVRSPA